MSKIDLAIKSKFRNDRHRVAVNMLYTSSWLTSIHVNALKPFSISLQQHNVLRILRGQHDTPCNLNLVRERMLDKMSDASRIVDKLNNAGLLKRTTNTIDRRSVDIVITEKGLELLAQTDLVLTELDKHTSTLSDDEIAQLNLLLDKLRD